MKDSDFPSQKELARVKKKLDKVPGSQLLPENATPVEIAKYEICEKFVVYINDSNLTQKALAKKLGVDEAIVSKILHYHIDEFTTDLLVKYLTKIFSDVSIKIEVA